MPYLLLIDNAEVELPDEAAVVEAFRCGTISTENWIKSRDVESDWEAVGEFFPHLMDGGM